MATSQQAAKKLNEISATTKHKELLTSIRRYYSNAFTDRLKQDAINIFLGNYAPSESHVCDLPLWELDSDYYLHNFHVQIGTSLSMRGRRSAWLSSSDDEGTPRSSVGTGHQSETECVERSYDSYECRSGVGRRTCVVRRCVRQDQVKSACMNLSSRVLITCCVFVKRLDP